MNRVWVVFAFIGLTATIAAGADEKAGHVAYNKACKTCHGLDGTPNPAIAKAMKVDMRPLGSAEVQAESNDDLKKIIEEGKGKMHPVKTISGPDVDNVIAFVRTLKK